MENYENRHRLHKKKEVDLRDIMQEARTPPHNGYLAAASTSKCWNRKWLCPLGRMKFKTKVASSLRVRLFLRIRMTGPSGVPEMQ